MKKRMISFVSQRTIFFCLVISKINIDLRNNEEKESELLNFFEILIQN